MTIITFDEWSEMTKGSGGLGGVTAYHPSKIEAFLSKTIPYCRLLPVKSKRTRVKIRKWLRSLYLKKTERRMKVLLNTLSSDSSIKTFEPVNIDFEWELKTNTYGEKEI